jgi:hypothetical protein
LLIVLGVVGVAAVAYLAFTLLGGSDVAADDVADPIATSSEPGEATEPATDATDATENPSEIAVVEPTFEVFDARDPFEQLVAADTGGGSDTVGTTAPTTSTTPVVDGTQPTDTTTPPTNGDPSQTTMGGTTILLEDVFTQDGEKTALVVVDNEGYEATAGQTVAGDVDVLDIAGNCATMRYEDRRFILCEGEQIQK